MDPKKKKEEALKHDRRNTYGENDKSSRKSIRRRKRLVNQIYRHKVKQVLTANEVTSTEDNVAEVRRPDWKKSPDQPLGHVLLNDLIRDIKMIVSRKSFEPILFDRLTGGSLRVFEPFTWLEVGSVKVAFPRPAHPRVTRAVRRQYTKV